MDVVKYIWELILKKKKKAKGVSEVCLIPVLR